MSTIYLLCGVPGSGKTWVAKQLVDKFDYLENDDFIGLDFGRELIKAAQKSTRPIVAPCPFAERAMKERLEQHGITVIPVFILEDGQTIKSRYESRELRPIPQQHITRAQSIRKRAEEWNAFGGKSEEVLEYLRGIL